MKIVTAEQMRSIDKSAITQYNIPELILMENAGKSVADEIIKNFPENRTIGVIAGSGNNGGDGFVCARHLFLNNYNVMIFFTGKQEKLTDSARINYNICKNYNIKIININTHQTFKKNRNLIEKCNIIVDAILGTGINSPLRDNLKEIVEYINSLKKYVIAVDIPTGVFSDTPEIVLPVIKADKTITFGLPKISQILSPARKYVGELKVVNIGFPDELLNNKKINTNLITKEFAEKLLPQRPVDAHKGNFGHILVFAGSTGKTGAAIMASISALKAGAGMVTTICATEINNILESSMIEVMTMPVNPGNIDESINKILPLVEKSDVITAGCGISTEPEVKMFLSKLLGFENKVFVLDADALNIIAEKIELLNNKNSRFVLTPHIGEMARLMKLSNKEVIENRLRVSLEFANRYKVILVLKSAETIIASPEGEIYICNTGNEGMATAGSGDVLTGIISGFVAQNIKQNRPLLDGVILGVYIHSIAGRIAYKEKGSFSLMATDIMLNISEALKWLQPQQLIE